MDADVRTYIDAIASEHRPLFDRMHRLVMQACPGTSLVLSYGLPTYRVGDRRLYVGVWKHGISVYGWDKDRCAGSTSRHPHLLSGKGTIRLRSPQAADVTDDELRDLIRASLHA